MKIKYPTSDDIVEANRKAIELLRISKAERCKLIRSQDILDKVINDSKQYEGSIEDKAAVLLCGINQKHVFSCANKRTSYLVAHKFFLDNIGKAPLHQKEEAKFLVDVRNRKYDIKEVSEWLKK